MIRVLFAMCGGIGKSIGDVKTGLDWPIVVAYFTFKCQQAARPLPAPTLSLSLSLVKLDGAHQIVTCQKAWDTSHDRISLFLHGLSQLVCVPMWKRYAVQ
jgi:hypothetical protein